MKNVIENYDLKYKNEWSNFSTYLLIVLHNLQLKVYDFGCRAFIFDAIYKFLPKV